MSCHLRLYVFLRNFTSPLSHKKQQFHFSTEGEKNLLEIKYWMFARQPKAEKSRWQTFVLLKPSYWNLKFKIIYLNDTAASKNSYCKWFWEDLMNIWFVILAKITCYFLFEFLATFQLNFKRLLPKF